MKKFITILLTALNLHANDLYLYDKNNDVELTEVINNKLNVLPTIIGKTYTLTNSLNINTTNSSVSYIAPYRIAVLQKENTSTYFNQTSTEYVNDFKLPEVVKVKDAMFNFTVNGELYCVSESTNLNTLLTTLCSITFSQSTFFVKSNEKFTHVYVVSGNVTVLDNKSKKKKELKSGDYLVVTPQIVMSAREASVTKLGNSFSVKEVEDEEKEVHSKESTTLKSKLDNTLFANYGQNIFGIKLQ
jgi:hypothetical protein